MRGHLRALATMMPFSVEKASLGSPAMLHSRILTASPSVFTSANTALEGISYSLHSLTHFKTVCW
eukprot:4676334-Pyramimonas_sp.AAC.1